jgi:NADPH:quinone reductase-like Zn-dependent oxidoreductase
MTMKLRYKITGTVLGLVAIAVASLALVLSHDAACGAAPSLPASAQPMKAIAYRCYGPPTVLKVEDMEKPSPKDNEVLVRVRAASINPLDWHFVRGKPYVVRMMAGVGTPKDPRLGVDYAGTVESVGRSVTQFKPGDEVFGGRNGALAEYVVAREDRAIALKPANITFEQAAAVPVAGVTALQALRDQGKLQPGQKVLINGASGGVGTFAVQIAKSFGAEVTGVCSTRNVALVRSLGADHVIDYTQEDFTRGAQAYDLILDNVGNRALTDIRRVLKPNGTLVLIGGGGPDAGPWVGALSGPIKAKLLSKFVTQKLVFFVAELNHADLTTLGDLMRAGVVTPVIDRRYRLSETAAAMQYLEAGHARGKVIIDTGAP